MLKQIDRASFLLCNTLFTQVQLLLPVIMRKLLTLTIFILVSTQIDAQSIRVMRITDFQPIPNVFVYNSSKTASALSDEYGIVDLSEFSSSDTLIFQHPTYESHRGSVSAILTSNGRVLLAERLINLQAVTISTTRWEEPARAVPSKITEVSLATIAHQNPQTAADMLSQSGQVFVQKSQLGGGSPMIRGFSANSLLMVIDGVRLNNAIYRSGNLQNVITLNALTTDKAEVVFGPGTVIYGSDALGGVINYGTLRNELSRSGTKVEGSTVFRYSSANRENTSHVDLHIAGTKFSSLTALTWSDFGDLRAGKRPTPGFPDFGKDTTYTVSLYGRDTVLQNPDPSIQKFSGYNQFNFLQKFTYSPGPKLRFDYAIHHSNSSDIPRFDRSMVYKKGLPASAEWYYGPQVWHMQHLRISHEKETALSSRFILSASYQYYKESRNDRNFNSDILRTRLEQLDIMTLNLDIEKEIGTSQMVDYGIEGILNLVESSAWGVDSKGDTSNVSTRYPDGGSNYRSLAAYISHNYKISDKINLRTGIRYTLTLLDAELIDTTFYPLPYSSIDMQNGAVNGSIGLVWEPDGAYTIKTMFGTGFRSPNLDDVGKIFDSEPGSVVVPNPELRPEYAYNLEINLSKDINSRAYVQVDAYYTFLKDAMVRDDFSFNGMDSIYYDGTLSRVQAVVNTGSAFIYGFTLKGGIRLEEHWHLTGFITYTDGRDIFNDEPLRHAPPTFGRLDVYYRRTRFQGSFSWTFNMAKKWDDLSPSEQDKSYLYTPDGSPAWSSLDLKVSYSLAENVMLNAGIENILDQHYRPYSSGISAPGRNFILAIRAGF